MIQLKSYPGFERNGEAKSISRRWVASAIIAVAVATSAWGCSSYVESSDDWSIDDSSSYALFQYSPANISVMSAPVAYVSLKDDPPLVRSGYTDPSWGRATEAFFPATDTTGNQVLEIPQVLDWENTAAMLIPKDGD